MFNPIAATAVEGGLNGERGALFLCAKEESCFVRSLKRNIGGHWAVKRGLLRELLDTGEMALRVRGGKRALGRRGFTSDGISQQSL